MPVVKRARYEAVCDMCDRQNGSVEYTSKRETRQAVQKEGWEVDGDALYCEYCATRAGWRCQGCNRWYPARPAYTSCATCDKADQARLEIVRSEMQVRARCAEGRRSGAQTQPDILTYHSMSDRKIMDSDWRAVLQCPWHSDLKGR